jgi:hypothetical protein
VDPNVRSQYSDRDTTAAFAVEMINEVVSGITGIKIAVICAAALARVPEANTPKAAVTARSSV